MNHSALRALDILELLAASDEGLTVTQVASALAIPKSSAFDLLAALQSKNFVALEDPRSKTYTLGLACYRVGMAYISRMDLYSAAHSRLEDLAQQLGQTVYLAVAHQGSILYLDKVEGNAPIRMTMKIGHKNVMHRTGLGKAILADWTEAAVREAFPGPYERRTETTITSVDALVQELIATRTRGYALDIGEDNSFLRCVAVPIRSADGSVAAAISTTMLTPSFEELGESNLATLLTEAALDISRKLGFRGTQLY